MFSNMFENALKIGKRSTMVYYQFSFLKMRQKVGKNIKNAISMSPLANVV